MAASCVSSTDERNADATLSHVEEIMSEFPDSALGLLSDPELQPQTQQQKALYALLLTQARHKNYIDETNDSLIATAVDYFDRKGDEQHLMKSLFYHTTINYNASEYPAAMTSAMRAMKLAEQLNDTYWQARIAETIAHTFSQTYFFRESIKYQSLAARLYKENGRENNYLYSLCDLAVDYSNIRDYDSCLIIVDSVKRHELIPNLRSYCAHILLPAYIAKEEYELADQYADTLVKYSEIAPIESIDYSSIAMVKLALDKQEEFSQNISAALELAECMSDSLLIDDALLRNSMKQNDIVKTNEILSNILNRQNRIARMIKQQSGVTAQRNYYLQEAAANELEAQRRFYLIIVSSVAGLLLCCIISFIAYYMIQKKNADIKDYISQVLWLTSKWNDDNNRLTKLNSSLSAKDLTIEQIRNQLQNTRRNEAVLSAVSRTLFKERLEHLNLLINEYYESDDSLNSQKVIYKNIKKEIAKLIDNKNISEIERIVDACGDDIMQKMRSQLPFLSSEDTDLIALTLAGYGGKAISLFLNMKLSNVYVTRKRIIDKIAASDAMDRDWFVAMLRNPDFR